MISNLDEFESSHPSSTTLPPEKRLALLSEWRDALHRIVESDPDAVETRKTVVAIERQIAELSSGMLPGGEDGIQKI